MIPVRACPACGDVQPQQVVAASTLQRQRYLAYSRVKYGGLMDDWLDHIELVIDRCPVCGHHWYREQPDPDQLSAMYSSGRPLKAGADGQSRTATPTMLSKMKQLYRLVGGGQPKLLDYGSGFGRWSRAAVQAGFRVTAFEPSMVRAAETGVSEFELVHDVAALTGRRFQALNVEQVLEHVPDPFAVLRGMRDLCDPDAIIRITVPNILRSPEGSALWRVWPYDGQRDHTLAPFEHLHGFTPRSLRSVVSRAGFIAMTGSRVWRYYPLSVIRNRLGSLLPSLGHTLMLAMPAPCASQATTTG